MFTYKKYIPVGRYRSFEPEHHDIKLNKKVVGHISVNRLDREFIVSFAIKKESTKEDPAPFKWVMLKTRFKTADEAKEALAGRFTDLVKKLDLYSFKD